MGQLSAAQQLHQFLGIPLSDGVKQAFGNKNASTTKAGPGRYHEGGKSGNRIGKERPQRAYVALMAAWAAKRVTKAQRRDEHGSYTVTGSEYECIGLKPTSREHLTSAGSDHGEPFYRARRIWLAGISAQRGY